jgi:DNA-binding beta-propeller fold protein YncE
VFLTAWGDPGSGAGEFADPFGVAIDLIGHVYVTDTGNNRVQKFTSDGNYLGQWGGSGSGPGQFEAPRGIVVDAAGFVYVTDGGNNRIQKFEPA